MDDYKEIKLNKFRTVVCYSVLFFSFFGGKFYYTGNFFGLKQIKQQRIKIKYRYFDDGWSYNNYIVTEYKWQTIK